MSVRPPERLAAGIFRIDAIGIPSAINVLAVSATEGWTLVDTGIVSSVSRIQAGLVSLGVTPDRLVRIFLTHHHPDHVGGLTRIREWAPAAEVVASPHEAAIISGRRPPDPSSNPIFRRVQKFTKLPVVEVHRTVAEGDHIGPMRVLATPGHTLGHTSLLAEAEGVLFTADAIGALPRKLRIGVRGFLCADPTLARESAVKLAGLEFTTAVFAHGLVLLQNARETVSRVANEGGPH